MELQMAENENHNPSPETQMQINEGVNFVYNWLTERHNAGKMSDDEYNNAIEKLRNTKIFPTDRGTDRLIDAYENGELKLKADLIQDGVSVSMLKKSLLNQSSHSDDMRGLSTFWAENPAILINIDKIKADNQERSDLSSVVAHELTHCIGLKDTSEQAIQEALYGKYNRPARYFNPAENTPQNISVQVIPDNSTVKYEHNENNGRVLRTGQKPQGMLLNEDIMYDPYTDKQSEIYARIMQMRFDMKLDPQKIYSPEDVEQMRKDLLKKRMEGKLSGADKDINNRIFERYSDEQISHFLNDTAHIQQTKNDEHNYLANIKEIMSNDFKHYTEIYASIENRQDYKRTTLQQKDDFSATAALLNRQREYS